MGDAGVKLCDMFGKDQIICLIFSADIAVAIDNERTVGLCCGTYNSIVICEC